MKEVILRNPVSRVDSSEVQQWLCLGCPLHIIRIIINSKGSKRWKAASRSQEEIIFVYYFFVFFNTASTLLPAPLCLALPLRLRAGRRRELRQLQ